MQNKKCLERCLELIRDKRYRELSAILAEQNPVDLADLLEGLPQEQGALAFRTLPKEQAAEVFSNLPPDTQQIHRVVHGQLLQDAGQLPVGEGDDDHLLGVRAS